MPIQIIDRIEPMGGKFNVAYAKHIGLTYPRYEYNKLYGISDVDTAIQKIDEFISDTTLNLEVLNITKKDGSSKIPQINLGPNSIDDVNTVISNYASAFGTKNIAGLKAFPILKYTPNKQQNTASMIVYLGNVADSDGAERRNYNDLTLMIGEKYSSRLKGNWLNSGKIESLGVVSEYNNKYFVTEVTVNGIETSLDSSEGDIGEGYSLFFVDHPTIGSVSIGSYSMARGYETWAGFWAFAEGYHTRAMGRYSHAEGQDTFSWYAAHAEGQSTRAYGHNSHAEGFGNVAFGIASHAEGSNGISYSEGSHKEGLSSTRISVSRQHSEDYNNDDIVVINTQILQNVESLLAKWEESSKKFQIAYGKGSHAEGLDTISYGLYSHAEGSMSISRGQASHAEGSTYELEKDVLSYTIAEGIGSHAEGQATVARGAGSHAEGRGSIANNDVSHAEGILTKAYGDGSHAEGYNTKTSGSYSHAEGGNTEAAAQYAHAEGQGTIAIGSYAHTEGYMTISGIRCFKVSEIFTDTQNMTNYHITIQDMNQYNANIFINQYSGKSKKLIIARIDLNNSQLIQLNDCIIIQHEYNPESLEFTGTLSCNNQLDDNGDYILFDTNQITFGDKQIPYSGHAEGNNTFALANFAHAEGQGTRAIGIASHAEGRDTYAQGQYSHTEGRGTTTASGQNSGQGAHAEGYYTYAEGYGAHAEGFKSNDIQVRAIGAGAHAEGQGSQALKSGSHAEGRMTVASGEGAHAEGIESEATSAASHAEGRNSIAQSKEGAHAEGYYTISSAQGAHSEGDHTTASHTAAHTEGYYTQSSINYQHVQGKYNAPDTSAAHIVGWGTSDTSRKNIHTLSTEGNAWFAGDVTVGPSKETLVKQSQLDALLESIEELKAAVEAILNNHIADTDNS